MSIAKKRRRAKGEGSISERSDGTWQFRIDVGKDEGGNRQRKYLYARTRSALLRKITDEAAKGGGTIRPRAKGTVGEWMERWLRDDVKPNLAANTFAQYESMWRVHTSTYLSHISLERLDVPHVEHLYARLRQTGISSAVLQRVAAVMARAISVAIRRRAYFRPNPFAVVEKPRHRYKEAKVLTARDARRFVKAACGDRYEALWLLLVTSGLRLGEALALEWVDIDFERATLAVRQGLIEINGATKVGPLKTRTSRRKIELGKLAVGALRRRRHEAKVEGHGSKFVFTTANGGHPRRSNLRSRHFQLLCQTAGIEGVTIHGLRHSMTTFALAEGFSPKVVAERLGHSTVRLTQDRYQHLLPGLQRRAATAIDSLLGAQKTRSEKRPKAAKTGP
jgi:integrase